MTESSPLLGEHGDAPYDRFSPGRKRSILAIISFASVVAPFAAGSFVPTIPEVAKDLNTSGAIINVTVGLFIAALAVGTLIWAPYSRFYGRQPIYLCSLPILCVGSLGSALAQSVIQLTIARIIQGFGAASVMSVGAATISDIYTIQERGTAMGIYFGATLLGPALAPLTGGIVATYSSWRVMQLILFGMACIALGLTVLFLPETSHPGSRGIDKLLADEIQDGSGEHRTWRFIWLSPLDSLRLLKKTNILLVVMAGGFTLVTDFVLLIPLSYTLGVRYGLRSPAIIGLCFLPSGIGKVFFAPLAGFLSDKAVIQGRNRRRGHICPEDRLLVAIPGSLFLVPFSVLAFGLVTQFITGKAGLSLSFACLFINGIGVDIVLSPAGAYLVDVLRERSAEVMSVNSAFRNVVCALASAAILPLINSIGIVGANALAAGIAWVACIFLWLVAIQVAERT